MTLTEAAINIPERASQIGDEIWANHDRLAERAGDALTPELLMMAANSAPHYLIGFVFMRNLHAAVEAYARQLAEDEHEGLVERPCEPRIATLVINKLDGWNGDARLYKLSVPMKYQELYEQVEKDCGYVIVSAVIAPYSGPETYMFAAHESGEPINFLELPGSFKGHLDHELALANAGYSVATSLPDCDGCRETLAGDVVCCQEKP